MSSESSLGGWQDVPIRITVVGKVKGLVPNQKAAVVEVSGAQFVATFDTAVNDAIVVGTEVLIDEELASIVGAAPRMSRNGQKD